MYFLDLHKFLPLKNKNFFVFSSFNRNFALPLTFVEGTSIRQPTVSVREARERNEKKSSIFSLHFPHLFVPL